VSRYAEDWFGEYPFCLRSYSRAPTDSSISLPQYRPLVWRNTHPYVLVDRHEDVTDPNQVDADETCNRDVVFYGYVRGTHLKPGMKVHVIGVGDFHMREISMLPDPCPIPEKERERTVSPNSIIPVQSNVHGSDRFCNSNVLSRRTN
jgi:AARP2CN (NUC121) domain